MQIDTFPVFPNLSAAISDSGLTRRELAQALGMSMSTLGRRLKGRMEFRWRELLLLQAVFPDIPMSVLLKRSKQSDKQKEEE